MKELILIGGGGGHCRSCIDVIEQEQKFKIAGIIDKKEFIEHDATIRDNCRISTAAVINGVPI